MKKILRAIFMSDLPIGVSYPLRLGLFYYATALVILISLYFVLSSEISNKQLVKEIFLRLSFVVVGVGLLFFVITLLYSKIVSRDYEKVTEFAESLSKGNLNESKVELSLLADADLIRIKESLERLKNSLIISMNLLKKKSSG